MLNKSLLVVLVSTLAVLTTGSQAYLVSSSQGGGMVAPRSQYYSQASQCPVKIYSSEFRRHVTGCYNPTHGTEDPVHQVKIFSQTHAFVAKYLMTNGAKDLDSSKVSLTTGKAASNFSVWDGGDYLVTDEFAVEFSNPVLSFDEKDGLKFAKVGSGKVLKVIPNRYGNFYLAMDGKLLRMGDHSDVSLGGKGDLIEFFMVEAVHKNKKPASKRKHRSIPQDMSRLPSA